jgi:hypothetical protein
MKCLEINCAIISINTINTRANCWVVLYIGNTNWRISQVKDKAVNLVYKQHLCPFGFNPIH